MYITKKLQTILYRLRLLENYLSIKQFKIVHSSLVDRHLDNDLIAWGGSAKTHLKPLDIIHKRVLNPIFNWNNWYPTELLFKSWIFAIILYIFIKPNRISYFLTTHMLHGKEAFMKHHYLEKVYIRCPLNILVHNSERTLEEL